MGQSIGALFRAAREQQGLSQGQVSELTESASGAVSKTTISSIERGRLPNIEDLVSLSRVLHVEPNEVLERVYLSCAAPVDLTGLTRQDLFQHAEQQFSDGDYRGALAAYDAALEHLALDPPDDQAERDRVRARIEINRAVSLRRCGALRAAQASAELAIDFCDAVRAQDASRLRADAYMVLAAVFSARGRRSLAKMMAEHAVRSSKRGDATHQAKSLMQLGNVQYRAGELESARQSFVKARELFATTDDRTQLAYVEGDIGACLLALGRRKHARTRFVAAIKLARRCGLAAIEASWLTALGWLALEESEFAEAERCAAEALRIARRRENYLAVFRCEWLRHKIIRAQRPRARDATRLARLKRLYVRIKDNEDLDEVRSFREQVLDERGEEG